MEAYQNENRQFALLRKAPTLLFATSAAMNDSAPAPTLFQRIGGRTKLQEILKYFYADVRQHNEIAPIFSANITDWPAHLETIADFWSGVTGGPANYSGAMPMKHVPLGLSERHFQAWLGLWARQCRARLAPAEAKDLIAIAETIGQRLRQIVAFHTPPAAN